MDEITITDAASGTRATIAPERGGMVTGLEVGGRAVLYLDRETLLDASKNVRGGIPLLFPSPGKLEGDAWAHGPMKQHGFARNARWMIARRDEASVALVMDPLSCVNPSYPWAFGAEITYRVGPGTLSLEARIENLDTTEMPFGFGTHGYFAMATPASFALTSGATRAFDNVTKREIPFDAAALRLGAAEIDLHLIDHGASSIAFSVDGVPVTIDAPDHRRWVLWSLPGRPFVCVEPWTSPGNALNSGQDLIRLAPGATRVLTQTFRVG